MARPEEAFYAPEGRPSRQVVEVTGLEVAVVGLEVDAVVIDAEVGGPVDVLGDVGTVGGGDVVVTGGATVVGVVVS